MYVEKSLRKKGKSPPHRLTSRKSHGSGFETTYVLIAKVHKNRSPRIFPT